MRAPTIEICQAVASDARAIAEIHVASWQVAYADIMPATFLGELSIGKRTLAWQDAIERGRLHVSLARLDNGLVGWAAYGRCRDADKDATWGEVEAIYLHPSRYGQGIGALLIEHVCRALREIGYTHVSLWVLTGNYRARAFYERAGFVADGQNKRVEIGGAQLCEMRYWRTLVI